MRAAQQRRYGARLQAAYGGQAHRARPARWRRAPRRRRQQAARRCVRNIIYMRSGRVEGVRGQQSGEENEPYFAAICRCCSSPHA